MWPFRHLVNLIFFFRLESKSDGLLGYIHIERRWNLTNVHARRKPALTVVDEQVALQGEGGAEESFALLALEGSFLGVGLWRRASRHVWAEPPHPGQWWRRREKILRRGRLTCCSKAAPRGLKVQSASVLLPPTPTPHPKAMPDLSCLSDTSIPKVNFGEARGGAGHGPHRTQPQPPGRLIGHTPPPSSADKDS